MRERARRANARQMRRYDISAHGERRGAVRVNRYDGKKSALCAMLLDATLAMLVCHDECHAIIAAAALMPPMMLEMTCAAAELPPPLRTLLELPPAPCHAYAMPCR